MRIFISYKQEYGVEISDYIRKRIIKSCPNAQIFLDRRSVQSGDNWKKTTWKHISSSDLYIIVLDQCWVKAISGNESGYVRFEAEYICATQEESNIYVIPVVNNELIKGQNLCDLKIINHSKEIIKDVPDTIKEKLNQVQWPTDETLDKCITSLIGIIDQKWVQIINTRHLPVLFISSVVVDSGSENPLEYFGSITRMLALALHKNNSRLKIDFILKVTPTLNKEEGRNPQLILIEEAISRKDDYRAIILAPYETSESGEKILYKLLRENPKYPFFTIDKTYKGHQRFTGKKNSKLLPIGVMNNWEHGGKLAAKCFLIYLDQLKVTKPRLVLVKGLEGSQERIDGFTKEMKVNQNIRCKYDEINGEFSKSIAFIKCRDFLSGKFSPGDYHGFFCANDEMALGVREAIIEWEKNHNGGNAGLVIIGYDGILSVRQLLNQKDRYILNTIDVNLKEQVDRLTECIEKRICRKSFSGERYIPIEGVCAVNEFDQRNNAQNIISGYSDILKNKLSE